MSSSEPLEQTGELAWPDFIKTRVLNTITKAGVADRLDFLQHALLIRLRRKDLPVEALPALLHLVFLTYTRYNDRASRHAILEVLKELNAWNAEAFQKLMVPALVKESDKISKINATGQSIAPAADRLVLITWVNLVLSCVIEANGSPEPLLNAQALLLDSLMADGRKSVAKGALTDVRRTFRNNAPAIPTFLDVLSKQQSPRYAVSLGTAIDTSLRLKRHPGGRDMVAAAKPKIVDYYLKQVMGARTVPSDATLDAFHDFVHEFVDENTLKSDFLPSLDKLMLRSPEVVLRGLSQMVKALSFDPSAIFAEKWLEPLLNQLRSTSANVRASAAIFWNTLASRCHQPEALLKVTDAIAKTLTTGKVSSWEHRILVFNALSALAQSGEPAVSQKALEAYFTMVAKEPNEQAMGAAVDGVGRHLTVLIYNDEFCEAHKDVVDKVVKTSSEGLKTAKALARKSWAVAFGDTVWAHKQPSQTLSKHAVSHLQNLFATFDKIADKPLVWKDGPLEAYILVGAVSGRIQHWPEIPAPITELLTKHKYPSVVLSTSPKPSFLLWDRIYTKATTAVEGTWLVHALTSVFDTESASSLDKTGAGMLCAQALVWTLTSHPEHSVRRAAFNEIAALASKDKACRFFKEALTQWLSDLENNTKDSTAVLARSSDSYKPDIAASRIAGILKAITTFDAEMTTDIKEKELVELLILSHHELIGLSSDKQNWITLAQRAGVDPGALVKNHEERILTLLREAFSSRGESEMFYKAAMRTVSTLVFICPELVPVFVDMVGEYLEPKSMDGIGETEYGMWKMPEGELFVDVLNKNKNIVENRNRKGFEDEKWEEELRAELAKKKGMPAKKLTKEEQAAVNAQLKKESDTRAHVQSVATQIRLGLDLAIAVADGSQYTLDEDFVALSDVVLDMAKAGGGILVGDQVVDTLLQLARCLDETVHSIREAIAIASLRSSKVTPIPSRWLDERLGDLVNRVLYRLRFLTESQPLSPATFAFCFPLFYQVVMLSGVDVKDEEAALEQVLMAIDIIGFHCSEGESDLLPRKDMLAVLLHTIKAHPKASKAAKTSLVTLCESMDDDADAMPEIEALSQGLLSDESIVRSAALQGLELLDLTDIDYSPELWLACHDDNAQNAEIANRLWEENALDVEESYKDQLLTYAVSEETFIRNAASLALADAMKLYPDTISDTLTTLYETYKQKAGPLEPEYDQYGMVIPETLNRKDPWESRVGLALVIRAAAPHLGLDHVQSVCSFLIQEEALGDRDENVRKQMLEAGLAIVEAHGNEAVQELLSTFESYLNMKAPDNETHDYIRQAAVILYGGAARYLDPADPKVRMAVGKLIDTLDTPSEVVQSAVAECLPPLIKMVKEQVPAMADSLLKKLLDGEKYAHRRGAAYGLAGVVKGRGITALKECNIMISLKEAASSRTYQHRQGALFAFETLSATLGRLFEPYIIQIVPLLLACFSDSNMDVREAASDAARVIMSKISGHCVKLILPSILEGLEERQWRTKKASVELLGATAYCAPKQLSVSLPNIIPRITEVLADTHVQVQAAANRSLQLFGEVISNPEIQQLVPELLDALSDPNRKTKKALTALLQTSFVHYIDPPSLALVMPILERGLRERGTEIKTKSTQIVGNMASLTDQRDLIPYLPILLPGVREVLVDPVPEARGTAAKALGGLVEKLGEDNFPELVNELLDMLKTDSGGVDRQGAAQGLSEVLAGLGLERMDALLPEIIANADSPRSHVREGFISLLIYLPATFGGRFQPYLGRIIPPILMGLADESEFVRDASLRAGRMIVTNYATKAVDLLLPELEKGLFDDNWRIRQSSVQLVGDLLFRITGTANPKATFQALGNVEELRGDEEDEDHTGMGDAPKKKQLVDVLGKPRRDRILAALYIIRQDASGLVRQASLQVWKALVSNTPRMLKDILPVMMNMIIKNLASASYEQRAVAARTLGELVHKLGEGVLAEILPILEEGLSSDEEGTRQGVTIAFSEVMTTAGKVQVLDFADQIIPAIRKALCDSSDEVREAAAQAFDTLHQNVGSRAIDEILPDLLNQLQSSSESSVYALSALKEIMAVRANVVFPVLIPTLIAVPITAFNARALASLVTVAGPALNRRLATILSALVESRIQKADDAETTQQLVQTTEALLQSVDDEDGLHVLMVTLLEYSRSERPEKRSVACEVTAAFFAESKLDASEYVGDWISTLISLLGDRTEAVVKSAWQALNAVTKSVKKDEYEELVVPVRRSVRSVGVPGTDVAGFCLPKGISPVLPIFLQGLMYGSSGAREQAALGVGDLISRTSADALKPFVTQITGPLIRIVGDRYPPQVKAAILHTLCALLTKVSMHLKPFLPQLQRTFIKSLSDTSSSIVRSRAASALGILITLQTRVDPLVSELVSGIRTSEPSIKETMMDALQNVVAQAGSNMNETSKRGVMSVIAEGLADGAEAGMMASAARLLGSLSKALQVDDARPILQEHVLAETAPAYGALLAINAILLDAPTLLEDLEAVDAVVERVVEGCAIERAQVPEAALTAAGKFMLTEYYQNGEILDRLVPAVAKVIASSSAGVGESKRMALVVLRAVARKHADLLEPYLDQLVPPMMSCVRDRNIPVKLTAERALLFTLQLHAGNVTFEKYLGTVDSATQKQISDYHRRVLSKLVGQEQQRVSLLHGAPDEEAQEEDAEVWQVGSIAILEADDE